MITQSDSASNALRIDTLLRIPPLSSRTGFCHTSVSATALYASSSSLSDIVFCAYQSYIGSSAQIFTQTIFLKYCTELPVTYPFYFPLIRNIQSQKKLDQCCFSRAGSSSDTSGFPFRKNTGQVSQYLLLSVCFTDMIYLYIHIFSPPVTYLVNNTFKRIIINQNFYYLCSII